MFFLFQPCLEVLVVLPLSTNAMSEFQAATELDSELSLLAETILAGWPEKITQVTLPIKQYFSFRNELSVHNKLILKSDQIVVPKQLRPKMLQLIHQGHLGTNSCINRARSSLFWIGMPFILPTLSSVVKFANLLSKISLQNRYFSAPFLASLGRQ